MKYTPTAVFLKSRLEIYLPHTSLLSQKHTAPGVLSKSGHSTRQTHSNAPSSYQTPHRSNGNCSAVAVKQKVKKNSVSFDSHTAFNCSQWFWSTIFHYTEWHCLHWTCPRWWGTVKWQKVHVLPTHLFLRGPVVTASSCDKQANFRGQTPMLGSVLSLRHLTKCLSAGFKHPLDSTQMPSRVLRLQTVFTHTSRRKATVSKLSSHLIWK